VVSLSVSVSVGRMQVQIPVGTLFRRLIFLSNLLTRIYLGQLNLSSFRGRLISISFGWGLKSFVRLQGDWMRHELPMQLKANLVISHSPEVAACAAISPSV